jgi:hypothetical protein
MFKKINLTLASLALFLASCGNKPLCTDEKCQANNKSTEISCKLSTNEMRKRRETVLADLKKEIIEKKEMKNGFAFKFAGTDENLDQLSTFIKTERACCDFFTFNLSVSGDKSEIWMELIGPDGTKDMIKDELELLK